MIEKTSFNIAVTNGPHMRPSLALKRAKIYLYNRVNLFEIRQALASH